MTESNKYDIAKIASAFALNGKYIDAAPYGSGHINDTFAVRIKTDSGEIRYIFQRINHNVFTRPEHVMENIDRVTRHLRDKIIAAGGDPMRETLNLVPTVDGNCFYRDEDSNTWRTYYFIEDACTYDLAEKPEHLYSAARAFGTFQGFLSDLPGGPAHETIVNFHNTPWRFENFDAALKKDSKNRAGEVETEIEFCLARRLEASRLVDLINQGKTPARTTHNDTKYNNVMIDNATGQAICVIDLDTIMPGFAGYDFGDLVRTGAATALEDEPQYDKAGIDMVMFENIAKGYLETAGPYLLPLEIDHLVFSAKLMTFENGLRFLTDYLNGDVYFKIHREKHNLDRCRTQIQMVKDFEKHDDELHRIVEKYRP